MSQPTALSQFFSQFADFSYDESRRDAWGEWKTLSQERGWDNRNHRTDEGNYAFSGFRRALVMQFNEIYGTDVNDLDNWQRLCRRLDISPLPDTPLSCIQAVLTTHVCLIDLMDQHDTDEEIETFPSVAALAGYVKRTGKFMPSEDAYAGPLLMYLMRELINRYNGRRRVSTWSGERRVGRGRGRDGGRSRDQDGGGGDDDQSGVGGRGRGRRHGRGPRGGRGSSYQDHDCD